MGNLSLVQAPFEYANLKTIHFNYFYSLSITRKIKLEILGVGMKHIISKTLHDIENIASVSSTVNIMLN